MATPHPLSRSNRLWSTSAVLKDSGREKTFHERKHPVEKKGSRFREEREKI
jgi:hypothetical protein